MYKYEGRKLDRLIAGELILELFAGRINVKRAEIDDRVLQEHLNRGGKPHTRDGSPCKEALKNLSDQGRIQDPGRGYWSFKDPEKEDSRSEPTTDIQKHIEQEYIVGNFNRLQPLLEKSAITAKDNPNSTALDRYLELERLALELARYALDYYEITYKNKV